MKKIIALVVLFLGRWKTRFNEESRQDKCVVIAAPHTSNWDFLYAIALYWKYKIDVKFFIKDSYTKGIIGYFVKKMGGIGVNRGQKNNLVDYAANLFHENEKLVLIVPAEGTRKKVDRWRKGFYHISKKANVPIVLGYLDYTKRIGDVNTVIHLTDSFENDMEKIQEFYKGIEGKHPENYNPKIY